MNKLGFAIKVASQGTVNAIECNKGQWTNNVVDIRENLKLFNGLQGDNVVTFISFDETGCYLTQLRAISGRGGDFLSGWIYIPSTIEATGDEIMNAYKFVGNILSQSNVNESKQQIDDFFSREYPLKEYAAPYKQSQGDKFGVRFLETGPHFYTMKEILGNNRYQPYYSDCKAIFLMEKNGEVSITKEAAQNMFSDYTNKEIVKSAVLVPPSSESLQRLGRGTKIYSASGEEFKEPMSVSMGTKRTFFLKREGFENLKFEETIQQDVQNLDVSKLQVEWSKKISSSMFKVFNSKHEPIEKEVNITVNGEDITYKEILVSEDMCRDAIVKVSASDCESYENRENLLRSEIPITLKRKNKTFQCYIELANGREAKITLESKYIESSNESPLKGYDFDDNFRDDKYLRMSSEFMWKQRLYGFLAAIAVGLFFAAIIAFNSWYETHQFKFGLPPWEDIVVNEDTIAQTGISGLGVAEDSLLLENDAIMYLDKNTVWEKSKMEKYPQLLGLFDDLNEFKIDAIINDWQKLSDSEKMSKIIEAAKKTKDNGWNPTQNDHNPKYNKDDNMRINVEGYIKWLNQDQTNTEKSSDSKAEVKKSQSIPKSASTQKKDKKQADPALGKSKKEKVDNENL